MTRRLIKESKPVNKWLGARLCQVRKRFGLTQQALGALIGRTDSTVSDLENGYSEITADHLTRFARGLGLPVAGLLLPDPGYQASSPVAHTADAADVVDLLVAPAKREALGRLLEALPLLTEIELQALVSNLPPLARNTPSSNR